MTYDNIAKSLDATEQALGHLATQLENGGFQEGAGAYARMAEVIVAQALTLRDADHHDLNADLRRIRALAQRVHAQLHPYTAAMERLLSLQEIVPSPHAEIPADTLGGRIVEVLEQSAKPSTFSALRTVLGSGTRETRTELDALIERGVVLESGSKSRPVYALAG